MLIKYAATEVKAVVVTIVSFSCQGHTVGYMKYVSVALEWEKLANEAEAKVEDRVCVLVYVSVLICIYITLLQSYSRAV